MKIFEQIESDASRWEYAPETFPALDAKTNRAIAGAVVEIDDLALWAEKTDWAAEKYDAARGREDE